MHLFAILLVVTNNNNIIDAVDKSMALRLPNRERLCWTQLLLGSLAAIFYILMTRESDAAARSLPYLSSAQTRSSSSSSLNNAEFNDRHKLFVGILLSKQQQQADTWPSRSVELHSDELDTHADKLVFFATSAQQQQQTLSATVHDDVETVVVAAGDNLLHAVEHTLAQSYANDYDWFFFVRADTFVSGSRLATLVKHLNVAQDLYMGRVAKASSGCDTNAGVLLSQVIKKRLLIVFCFIIYTYMYRVCL